MASIYLGSAEFKSYAAEIGPGLRHPARPSECPFCDGRRVWFDGWHFVFCAVLADDVPHRFDDGLPLQRVCCADCERSWTLRPSFLYPYRSLEPDVAEAAALSYLSTPSATYEKTARAYGCSARTLWRWVGWLAGLFSPRALLAEAEQLSGNGQSAALIPRDVPQDHEKARSPEREQTLLSAFQAVCALAVWVRAQPAPPTDPSPLRFWLIERFRSFREVHRLVPKNSSPPLPEDSTGPPSIHRRT